MAIEDLIDLENLIEDEEGWRATVYDDATRKPIVPGSVVIGHPTIAWGFRCDGAGFTKDEMSGILYKRLVKTRDAVVQEHPWVLNLTINRQDVFVSIAYNAGEKGLDGFHNALAAGQKGDYEECAKQIEDSALSPRRKTQLADLMRKG